MVKQDWMGDRFSPSVEAEVADLVGKPSLRPQNDGLYLPDSFLISDTPKGVRVYLGRFLIPGRNFISWKGRPFYKTTTKYDKIDYQAFHDDPRRTATPTRVPEIVPSLVKDPRAWDEKKPLVATSQRYLGFVNTTRGQDKFFLYASPIEVVTEADFEKLMSGVSISITHLTSDQLFHDFAATRAKMKERKTRLNHRSGKSFWGV